MRPEPEIGMDEPTSLSAIARLVHADSDVLELGPGDGRLARQLARVQACRVDCVERSEVNAAAARTWARDVWEGDLDSLDLRARVADRRYDFVVAADVLEHLEDPRRVLEECRAVLRPNGVVLLSLPNVGHAAVVLELLRGRFPYGDFGLLDRTHRWFFTRESALRLLRDAGYRVDDVHPIVRMPETTEFHHRLDRLSPTLRADLLQHPDALTYQFVVRARPGATAESRPAAAVAVAPELRFRAKAYWAAPGDSTCEELHVARVGRLGVERQTMEFPLPEDGPVSILRFDPSEEPGFVHLHRIRLWSGAALVVDLDSPRAILERTRLHGIRAYPDREPETFLMEGSDPHMEILLPSPLPPGPARRLVVEMGWPASRDYTLASEQIASLAAELAQERAARGRERHAAETRIAAAETRIAAAERRFDEATARAVAAESTLDQVLDSKGWRFLEALRRLKFRRAD